MPRNSIEKEIFHYKWSKSHKPVLWIKPGDSVHFEVNEVTSGQVTKKSRAADVGSLDFGRFYPMSGPVFIEGAEPGDALVVHIDKVRTADWGWTAVLPGSGLLTDEFQKPALHIWNLGRGRKRFVLFKKQIKVKLAPFCGVLGVAPKEEGYFDVMPPGRHGGNMDTRHLTEGATVTLPVWNEGALFSVADVHAAQGDGEVCVTAIECPGEVDLTFDLLKHANLSLPKYITARRVAEASRFFGTMGIAPDLMEASKQAVRAMIDQIVQRCGISREEAYMLCSVAGDLRIHEVVDRPNWVVGMMVDSSIFEKL